ncbi:ABC transporter permease, partial [Frankia sp. Cj3]|uniref:ABC transporter permease n=1 Tax=Frankia sp. Cj3 TaxID=2880976 RepID=UPI001EF672E0
PLIISATVTLGIISAVPLPDRSARYPVATSGIVIGRTMTACTLIGRHLFDATVRRRDEVEARLMLGATPRGREPHPHDRTENPAARHRPDPHGRTITLPGACVRTLLDEASPTNAAQFQLTVLVAPLTAETLAAVTQS